MTGRAEATPTPAPYATWRVTGGVDVDVDDLRILSAVCRRAAAAVDRITTPVVEACVRGEAALALLAALPAASGAGRGASPVGAVAGAALLVEAPRALLHASLGLAELGLRLALAADRYAAAERSATSSVGSLLRSVSVPGRVAGETLGYVDRLAGRKGVEAADGSLGAGPPRPGDVDPDTLEELLAGPAAATYPRRVAVVGAPHALGQVDPPRGVADLLRYVVGADASPPPGRVDVVAVTGPDAGGTPRTSYVVALPGTSDWSPPWADRSSGSGGSGEPRNLQANLQLMSGNTTAELAALPAALAAAGVPRGANVAFVGHSQGGITAYAAAADPTLRATYRIGHVVTAGSPIGAMPVPDGARVLALEHAADIVPRLDGRANPDSARRLTVSFRSSLGLPLGSASEPAPGPYGESSFRAGGGGPAPPGAVSGVPSPGAGASSPGVGASSPGVGAPSPVASPASAASAPAGAPPWRPGRPDVPGPHDMSHYVAAGARVDAADDPRLAEFVTSLREEGLLVPSGAATATLTRVDLRLAPP